MENIQKFLALAVLVESVVTLLLSVYVENSGKKFWQNVQWKILISIGVGEVLAFAFNADIMTLFDLPQAVPPIGLVLTGLVLGRGSNFVHDLYSTIKALKESKQLSVLGQIEQNRQLIADNSQRNSGG